MITFKILDLPRQPLFGGGVGWGGRNSQSCQSFLQITQTTSCAKSCLTTLNHSKVKVGRRVFMRHPVYLFYLSSVERQHFVLSVSTSTSAPCSLWSIKLISLCREATSIMHQPKQRVLTSYGTCLLIINFEARSKRKRVLVYKISRQARYVKFKFGLRC